MSTFHLVCWIGIGKEIPVANMKLIANSVHVVPGSLRSGMVSHGGHLICFEKVHSYAMAPDTGFENHWMNSLVNVNVTVGGISTRHHSDKGSIYRQVAKICYVWIGTVCLLP